MLGWGIVALLGVAGVRLFGYRRPSEPYRCLTRGEVALVEAASDALFPPGGAVPPSGKDAGIAPFLDGFLAANTRTMRTLMRLLLVLVEHATLIFPAGSWITGRRRFSSLSPEQRVVCLEGWRTSSAFPRRLVFTSLRSLLTMGYFGSPAVLRSLDLAPRDIETRVVEADLLYPPAGRPRSEIAYGPGDLTPAGGSAPLGPATPLHPAYREGAA